MKYKFKIPETYVKPEPAEIPIVTKPANEPENKRFWFNCICCFDESHVLFSGSSYCKKCYLEKLRTGK